MKLDIETETGASTAPSESVSNATLRSRPESVPRPRPKSGYIKTLDGWRTIAVCGVMLFHARPIILGPFDLSRIQNFGEKGVQLFFAISGILICSRLLEEQRLHGQISLKGFYIRRIFRIQPAALVFLATIGILALIGTLHPSLPATLSSLFCFRNFYMSANLPVTPDDRYTVHFWSLAVEEHFYLLLPALLVLTKERIATVLAILSAAFFCWTPIAHHLGLAESTFSIWRTDMALRDLLVAALLAVLLTRAPFRSWMTKVSSYGLLILLTAGAILISEYLLGGHPTSAITCLGFPLIIASTMLHPEGILGRLLETGPFLFLGRISYSLYLWQELFFLRRPESSFLRHLQDRPWNVIAVLICATASYYVVEKPLMRLGHRLAPPATPGRRDLGQASPSQGGVQTIVSL